MTRAKEAFDVEAVALTPAGQPAGASATVVLKRRDYKAVKQQAVGPATETVQGYEDVEVGRCALTGLGKDAKKCSLVEDLVDVWEFMDNFRYQADPIHCGKTLVESSADQQGSDMTFQSIARELRLLQKATSPTSPPRAVSATKTTANAEERSRLVATLKAAALRERDLKRQKAAAEKVFEAQQWLPP